MEPIIFLNNSANFYVRFVSDVKKDLCQIFTKSQGYVTGFDYGHSSFLLLMFQWHFLCDGWNVNKNIWLPQKRMAKLFGCRADNISLHLKNIYKEKELDESSTAEIFSVVQIEGKREVARNVTCYSL